MGTTKTSGAKHRQRALRMLALAAAVLSFAVAFMAPARASAAEATGDLLSVTDAAAQQQIMGSIDQGATCSYSASVVDLSGAPMQGVSVRAWRVAELADRHGVSMTAVSLAWMLTKVTSPICGATKPHHIDGMVEAADLVLSADEIAYLEEPYVPHALVGVMAQNRA